VGENDQAVVAEDKLLETSRTSSRCKTRPKRVWGEFAPKPPLSRTGGAKKGGNPGGNERKGAGITSGTKEERIEHRKGEYRRK